MKIHPTAIVAPGAELGPDCVVGPYAVIDEHVCLGARNKIQAHAVITGRVRMGDDNRVGYGSIIGSAPQDLGYDEEEMVSEVHIGDGNTFREYVTIHRGAKDGSVTRVGDNNYIMTGAHLGHDVHIENRVIIANNCLLGGYVEVGDSCVLGGGTVFHQFTRLGRYCMVRGGTRFGKDIPPFTIGDEDNYIAGINAVGLRRNKFSAEVRSEISRAFKLTFRSGLNISQALEAQQKQTWSPECQHFFEFIRKSKRGVCRVQTIGTRGSEEEKAESV